MIICLQMQVMQNTTANNIWYFRAKILYQMSLLHKFKCNFEIQDPSFLRRTHNSNASNRFPIAACYNYEIIQPYQNSIKESLKNYCHMLPHLLKKVFNEWSHFWNIMAPPTILGWGIFIGYEMVPNLFCQMKRTWMGCLAKVSGPATSLWTTDRGSKMLAVGSRINQRPGSSLGTTRTLRLKNPYR